jgi:2-polyprenyl-6-methoxyphenol hydroxylase-like FAD-dependent oxidoreductase
MPKGILIAGAGIGGLTLALMLERRGIACTVFEAAAEARDLGVGITIQPHGVRELAGLGLLEALDRVAIRTRELRYLNHLGQTLWSEPRGLHAGHDMPQLSIHRGRLHGLLWRAAQERLPPGALRLDHRLSGCVQDAAGVTARFTRTDGTVAEERGDALVGADGIHSVLRGLLQPASRASRISQRRRSWPPSSAATRRWPASR